MTAPSPHDRIVAVLREIGTSAVAATNISAYAIHKYLRTDANPETAFDRLPTEYYPEAYIIAAALRSTDRYATGEQYPDTTRSDRLAADTILTALRHVDTTEATR